MSPSPVSARVGRTMPILGAVFDFLTDSSYARRQRDPAICDFVLGNPHELALPSFVQALQRAVVPRDKNWYAYTMRDPRAVIAVSESLRRRVGLDVDPQDVFLTSGAFAAIGVVLQTIVDAGDEVVFVSPPWFFYEPLIAWAGATPVRVRCDAQNFDLDLDAIARALTPRTRAIIVNSPNNPTGRVYPASTLDALARELEAASARHGRTIYLISDESYRRVVFDGRTYTSPARHYASTFVIYTYGKQLLTPGQRVGYIALPPAMPDREELRRAIPFVQMVTGWSFPNALLQHALPELEDASIDVAHLQRKRDRIVGELWRLGYEVTVPEGTFYLLPRSPLRDDGAFTELLARNGVFVLPGTLVEMPGYFRISLTANDEMIDRAVPGFAAAVVEAKESGAALAAQGGVTRTGG